MHRSRLNNAFSYFILLSALFSYIQEEEGGKNLDRCKLVYKYID